MRAGLGGLVAIAIIVLAFRDGGYMRTAYLELGTLAWIAIGLIALVRPQLLGTLGSTRVRIGLSILAGLALLSALAMIWSDSPERSALEALRVAGLLGVLALGVIIARRGGQETVLIGLAAAVTIVAGAALGSRALFELFPADETAEFLPGFENRLSYPLTYWNALAALMALGLPLVLHLLTASRWPQVRALAAAATPLIGLTLFLTLSRGGILAAAGAVAVTFALSPSRARFAAATALSAVLAAALSVFAAGQDELFDALRTDAAETQGIELLLVTLAVMLVAATLIPGAADRTGRALAQAASRLRLPSGFRLERRRAALATALLAGIVTLGLVATGAGSKLADDFTSSRFEDNTAGAGRLTSINSSTRAEYWASAIEAGAEHPLLGIGPGTWEFWWAENGDVGPFARDAHSLYLETFAELGVPGLALILALVAAVLISGIAVSRREPDPASRACYAALTGAAFAFAIAAALDWVWEVTVLPVAFMLVAAPLLLAQQPSVAVNRTRIAVALVAVIALAGFVSTLRSEWQISESQDQAARGDLQGALESAESATTLRRYAAGPFLQRALVEEALGRYDDAAASAELAADREPTNWRHQIVLSRVEDKRGDLEAARAAFDRGRQLNPRSPAFSEARRP